MYSIKPVFRKSLLDLRVLNSLRLSKLSSTSQMRGTDSHADDQQPYDIIITGGGMIGSALAAAIGHNNILRHKRVLLLESAGETTLKSSTENFNSACCALSHSTRQLLTSFGAWDKLLRYQKVHHMRVWDSGSDVGISFNLDSLPPSSSPSSSSSSSPLSFLFPPAPSLSSLSELAYIAENDVILSAITSQLQDTSVEVRYKSKVKTYLLPKGNNTNSNNNNREDDNDTGSSDSSDLSSLKDAYPAVVLEDGEKLAAKLLIGADGSNSLLRKTANIRSIGWPYKQTAVVATVKVDEDRGNNTAWQRFLKTGPIALLPLSDDHSCLIWTTSTDHSKHLLSLDPQTFISQVNHAYCDDQNISPTVTRISHALQDILVSTGLGQSSTKMLPPTVTGVVEGSRKSFPLSLCHADHYVKEGIVLIGDAAHRVHPLSGQGVNLGFGDVTCLVKTLQEGVLLGADIGSVATLAAYESSRQRRVLPMMASIDLFNRCYSNHLQPLVLLRSLACQVADSVPIVKQKMIQFAMG